MTNDNMSETEYWADVRGYAKEALRMIREEGRDEFDVLHELVDGSEWIIYNARAVRVLVYSPNEDEVEHQDEIVRGKGIWAIFTQAAFWAMYADVRDELEALRNAEPGETTAAE